MSSDGAIISISLGTIQRCLRSALWNTVLPFSL
jgi:hypothetical protein